MSGCPINIADFRCRALKVRAARPNFRNAHPSTGLSLVEPQESVSPRASEAQKDGGVYDISTAREAQRMRQRMVVRPISIQRRSNVLRFRSNEPIRMMKAEPVRMMARVEAPREKWRGATDSSYDLPPAA